MIAETIIVYIYDRVFIYQLIATLVAYCVVKIATEFVVRRRRFKLFKYYGIAGPKPSIPDGSYSFITSGGRRVTIDYELGMKYGKTYGYFFGDYPLLRTIDLDIIKKVFVDDYESFGERSYCFIDVSITRGILFCKRARWKLFRKALSPPFARLSMRGSSSTQFIEESIGLMTNYIDSKLDQKSQEPVEIDILDLMKSTALHMISKLALNLPSVQVKENEVHVEGLNKFTDVADGNIMRLALSIRCLVPVLSMLSNLLQYFTIMNTVYAGLNKRIKERVKQLIDASQAGTKLDINDADILDSLIDLYHYNKITKTELFGNAEGLLIAGYDTTSTTMTYTLWCLAKHPDIQTRLRKEVLSDGIESKYLLQVIEESMRLYPVVSSFVCRMALETVEVNGLVIPEGTVVVYDSYRMHRWPEYWKDPEKFDPDRFHESVKYNPLTYAPFGLGERRCVGYKLAMLEMKIVLYELITRYELILKSPQELDLKCFTLVLTKPRAKVSIEFVRIQK